NAAESVGHEHGTVELRTEVETIGEEHLLANLARTMPPIGQYVAVTVEDTGCGMDELTISRIFDPFFTTKFTGRGLGLSAGLGIVRGHKGRSTVDSQPGAGTKFRVFFPVSKVGAREEPSVGHEMPRGGTVLVVDDEEIVRKIAVLALQRFGFTV